MLTELTPWPRAHFEPGGGNAFVFFTIYGDFARDAQLSGAVYRTAGVPEGIDVRKLNREQAREFPFTSGSIGELLRPKQPGLFASIQNAPECMLIQGEIADPKNLNYLRDTVGLVMYFLDHGGLAAIDPQQFRLYDAGAWRTELFEPEPPNLANQVVILWSEDSKTTKWFHTRGLRKFGRPDLSMHNVPQERGAAVVEMFNRFILLQAQGMVIPEGQEVRMASLPAGLTCYHNGTLSDPDFNNIHVEICGLASESEAARSNAGETFP